MAKVVMGFTNFL